VVGINLRRTSLATLVAVGLIAALLAASPAGRTAGVTSTTARLTRVTTKTTARRPATTLIRVDQAGYPRRAVKAAFVMSRHPVTGPVLVQRAGSTTVDRFVTGPSLGAWNRNYPYVYKVVFSRVRRVGTYTITAGGAVSPRFAIAPAAIVYARDLEHSRYFYENERDGPNFIRTALRSAGGDQNDARATVYQTPKVNGDGNFKGDLTSLGRTVNASGGWWDAGDYLEFVQTTSSAAARSTPTSPVRPGSAWPG
jgi:endoglucanase